MFTNVMCCKYITALVNKMIVIMLHSMRLYVTSTSKNYVLFTGPLV